MIKLENPMIKNSSTNLQKVFQNIIAVVLLDVKNQFTYGNIDPTIQNLQTVLEKSLTTKFQEEEFLALHLKDFENSVAEYTYINEESLLNEKSVLEIKLRETQEKCDKDIKSKAKEIDVLKKELKEKEDILKDSIKSYGRFMKSNKELSNAKENAEKLEKENKQLKHKLKCMECNFGSIKKSYIVEKGKKSKISEEQSNVEADVVFNNKDKPATKEETIPIQNINTFLENNKHITDIQLGIYGEKFINGKEVNILEDSLNLSTLNTQVELLTEQIDKLNSKKIQVEDDIDVKEGKILSLQSTIDKMKIIILECKTKEHNVILQLDYANVTIDKLQRTISNLKKEKEEIHKDAERKNLKSTYIQSQWDRIVAMSNEKNDEIQSLRSEKKSLLHKIKEKNTILSSQHVEREKLKFDLDEIKQRYGKMDKNIVKLKNNYSELEKSCELLQYEKKSLEKELMERESVNENQLSQVLKQIHASEDEVKGESNKSVKGTNISAIAQKLINKHRNELASLKTNMHWMKEALEVSGKDRLDLQSQLSQKEEYLSKVEVKLSMFEETNKHLNANLVEHRADSSSLQKALQNAVVSYNGVCSLFDKQEKALQEERDTYNSEITDLHKKLKKKSNTKPASGFHPVESGIQFSEDLRFILNNIKDQLSSTLNNMNTKLEKEVQNLSNATHSFNATTHDFGRELNEDNSLRNSTNTSAHENIISNSTVGSNTQKLNDYLEMHNLEMSQSTFYSTNSDKTLTNQSKSILHSSIPLDSSCNDRDNSNLKDTKLSEVLSDTSVSSTVGQNSYSASVHQNSYSASVHQNSYSASVHQNSESASVHQNSYSASVSKTTLSNGENNAVQKLQEKLSQLHQMGTNLQTNNTELTEMMKTHTKRLKMLKNKAKGNITNN